MYTLSALILPEIPGESSDLLSAFVDNIKWLPDLESILSGGWFA